VFPISELLFRVMSLEDNRESDKGPVRE
jgi:hypothetical protein